MGKFEKISEKIMPYKIKSIISNTFADIMIINCGKYFEVQRINYKHETIFKKEVKKEDNPFSRGTSNTCEAVIACIS